LARLRFEDEQRSKLMELSDELMSGWDAFV